MNYCVRFVTITGWVVGERRIAGKAAGGYLVLAGGLLAVLLVDCWLCCWWIVGCVVGNFMVCQVFRF